jgi:hypothetical protein
MFSREMAQRIEHWKLAELSRYPKSQTAFRHADRPDSGQHYAVRIQLAHPTDARGRIIAGHGGYSAALKLGLEKGRDQCAPS